MGRSPVGGVDRISLQEAAGTPFRMAVWAMEPGRMVDVAMPYSDLKIICDLTDRARGGAER